MAYSAAQHSITAQDFALAGAPAAMFEENFPSANAVTDCAIGATTLATASLMYLYEGDVITNISVCVGGTASVATTHRLVGIYSSATVPAQLATSADNTTATLAANTVLTQALTAPFTVPASGAYYIVFQSAATTTMPTLIGRACGLNVTATAAINALLAGTRTNGVCLTATGGTTTLPATLATLTQLSVEPWIALT